MENVIKSGTINMVSNNRKFYDAVITRIAVRCDLMLEDTEYNELERISYAKACMDIITIMKQEADNLEK